MSSPCWSLPRFLSSSPPQHAAPPGQHDLLQDDTVHRAPLPEPIQSTSSANEPLSHVNYESGGNPRNTSPTVSRRRFTHFALTPRLSVWLKVCLKTAHTIAHSQTMQTSTQKRTNTPPSRTNTQTDTHTNTDKHTQTKDHTTSGCFF